MTMANEGQKNVSVGPQTTDELGSGATDFGSSESRSESAASARPASNASASSRHKGAAVLEKIRKLERRAIQLPVVGKLHAPDNHDVVYVAAIAALLTVGAVELPIALAVLGGHLLVKQHHSRSLSTIGEVMEDVWGHA